VYSVSASYAEVQWKEFSFPPRRCTEEDDRRVAFAIAKIVQKRSEDYVWIEFIGNELADFSRRIGERGCPLERFPRFIRRAFLGGVRS
jgi:hypothetical protein